jgi:hypothetical protein
LSHFLVGLHPQETPTAAIEKSGNGFPEAVKALAALTYRIADGRFLG